MDENQLQILVKENQQLRSALGVSAESVKQLQAELFDWANNNRPTLKDYFAMSAMQGQWANSAMEEVMVKLFDVTPETQQEAFEMIAKASYMMADAMLKVRGQ